MKRNKRRIDVRIKPYLFKRLEAIAEEQQTTYTDVLEQALEKGMNWQINKIRRELNKDFLKEFSPKTNQDNTTELTEEEKQRIIEIAKHRWIDDDPE